MLSQIEEKIKISDKQIQYSTYTDGNTNKQWS